MTASEVQFTCSAVIATRDRPLDLEECLRSLSAQLAPPSEAVIVDASDGPATQDLCERLANTLNFPVLYRKAKWPSSAVQRNDGARLASGRFILFADDDVVLEPDFLDEIRTIYAGDADERVGGVCGLVIESARATEPTRFGRMLLRLCAGADPISNAGRIIGPAINVGHDVNATAPMCVEWLHTGGVVYRTKVFSKHQFSETFVGYSFMEDVHLSARAAKTHTLLFNPRAKLFHKSRGSQSNRKWVELGRSMMLNRHAVMTSVLGRADITHYARLAAFELLYCTANTIRSALRAKSLTEGARALCLLTGRLWAAWDIVRCKSPHQAGL